MKHKELTRDWLSDTAAVFLNQNGRNQIAPEQALSEAAAGLRIFDPPIFGLSDAADPLYQTLKEPKAVGPWHLSPEEWLPGVRSVVSFFLPFSSAIQKSNRAEQAKPSEGWLHGPYEGQNLIFALGRCLTSALEAEGWRAVIPALDPRFAEIEPPGSSDAFPSGASFTSSWSERHAAYISGLGTFGLSAGLITERGICGRFGSLITNAPGCVSVRPYTGLYDYCTRCGACVRRCPVQAIDLEKGKDHFACCDYVWWTEREYAPRYGCGKCQVGVPCASKRSKLRTGKTLHPFKKRSV